LKKKHLILTVFLLLCAFPQILPGAETDEVWDQRYRYYEAEDNHYVNTWYRQKPSVSAFRLQIWRDEELLSETQSPATNRYEFESGTEGSRPLDIGEAAHVQAREGDEIRVYGVSYPDVRAWDWQCFMPDRSGERTVYWTQTPFEYVSVFETAGEYRYYLSTHNGSDWSSYGNYRVFKPRADTGASLDYWWYFTELVVDVAEAPPDLAVLELTADTPAPAGSVQEASAWIQNKGRKDETAHIRYYAGGIKIFEEDALIQAGDIIEKVFQFEVPPEGGIELKAEVTPLPGEVQLGDNVKQIRVETAEEKSIVSECPFGNSNISDGWTTTYVWTEQIGRMKFTRRAAVRYSEKLEMNVQINTYQDIVTNPNRATDSDWQSRGSWEIIPYSRDKGLNAQEVTRAGYGFEVKVKTAYQTDWETKVPPKARPYGGVYKGPASVKASFYDTGGRKVDEVLLVPTQGSAGDREIVWELPEKTHVFMDGTSIKERKHYVSLDTADGGYRVRVTCEPCGRNRLSLCAQKDVTIYGDLYDDLYTRPEKAR
jgi:hypothetical protein